MKSDPVYWHLEFHVTGDATAAVAASVVVQVVPLAVNTTRSISSSLTVELGPGVSPDRSGFESAAATIDGISNIASSFGRMSQCCPMPYAATASAAARRQSDRLASEST